MHIVEQNQIQQQSGLAQANHPVLVGLEQYWKELRGAKRIPARNEIEPHRIDDALPHAFILQRVAPGVARMRVAGQGLHDILKMDARGMPVSTFFTSDAREDCADMIETAFNGPAIVSATLVSPGNMLRPTINGQILLLPLRDDKGATTRILGALVTDAPVGARPRRFTLAEGVAVRNDPLFPQLASEGGTPLVHKKGPDAAHPALRLVVNNG